MRDIIYRVRRVVGAGALAVAIIGIGACDRVREDLLKADDPDIIDPTAINSPEGADALRVGALARLRTITAGGEGAWLLGGLLTDEWKSSDTFSQRNETDERKVQDNNGNVAGMHRDITRPLTAAREAMAALTKYRPLPEANFGQMYFVMGFTEMTIAETFCNGFPIGDASSGVPLAGPPLSNVEIYTLALAHFDSALLRSTATDAFSVATRHSAAIGKGRALVNLKRFAEAAAAVAAVPTSYRFDVSFSLTAGNNQIWSLNTSAKRWTVGDSFDTSGIIRNAIPFASSKDPRLPNTGSSTGTSAAGKGFDGSTNFIFQSVYGRTDPTPVVSGLDARLIEAEAKLNLATPDIAGMMTILNALRAAPPSLGTFTPPAMTALATPATLPAAIDLYFREKAYWTYARGQRLGDLRRLIRQYGRAEANVFPAGTFFKTNVPYGTDVNFPVTRDELNNPAFKQCADRAA